MSLDGHIDTPAASVSVGREFRGLATTCGVEQDLSQPCGIGILDAECVVKYPCLVPAAWVSRVEAVIFDFADVEDCLFTMRQA
jgi:hypothetical protein